MCLIRSTGVTLTEPWSRQRTTLRWTGRTRLALRRGFTGEKKQVRHAWTSFVEAFDELRWDPEEIIEVDESRLIAVNHVRMRGRGSGIEVDAMGAQLWTIARARDEASSSTSRKPRPSKPSVCGSSPALPPWTRSTAAFHAKQRLLKSHLWALKGVAARR